MRSVCDPEGYIVSINPAHHVVLGWSIEDLSSVPYWEFVHPDDRAWANRWQRMLLGRSDAFSGLDLRMLRRDGTYQWTRWNARSMARRRRVCLDGVAISVREPAQSSTPVLVGSWDWYLPTGTATWSEEMFEIFGLATGAHITLDAVLARVHPGDRERVRQAMQDCLSSGKPYRCDYRILHTDGRCRVLHCVGRVIRDGEGSPEHLRGITQARTDHAVAS